MKTNSIIYFFILLNFVCLGSMRGTGKAVKPRKCILAICPAADHRKAVAVNTHLISLTKKKNIYTKCCFHRQPASAPAKYVAFSIASVNNSTILTRTIIPDVNVSRFEVERSFDSKRFKTVDVVDGIKGADNLKTYKCRDNGREIRNTNIIYYRLKQIGLNGSVSYSALLTTSTAEKQGDSFLPSSPENFVLK